MVSTFTRRHKLDHEAGDLHYQSIPNAVKLELANIVLDRLHAEENATSREYSLYRNLSVALHKSYQRFYGEDEIHEYYSTDLFIDLIETASWHEFLSIVERLVSSKMILKNAANKLFAYHNIGYEVVKDEDGDAVVEVRLAAVVEETACAVISAEKYPGISALIEEARKALVDPTAVSPATAVTNAVKAVEGFVKQWLMDRNHKPKTLGDAVKILQDKKLIDHHIAESLKQIYVYRNSQPNVGHGSTKESEITASDARLVLDMASSFINYFHRIDKEQPKNTK